MNHKTLNKTISEGLGYEDMKGLVGNEVHIDRYKPKIGTEDETVVVAIIVTYEEPAKELGNFIESGDFEHLDVEASEVPEPDGSYRVFVEFQRDHNLFEKLQDMLNDLDQITNKTNNEWKYVAFRANGNAVDFTEENFRRDIVDSASEYRRKYLNDGAMEESINRLKKLIKY